MRRTSTAGGVLVAVGLALAMSVPVAAEDPPPQSNVEVRLTITGYTAGAWGPVFGSIGCEGLPENIDFGIGMDSGGTTGLLEAPTGLVCQLGGFWPEHPGDNAAWGDWVAAPSGPWTLAPGETQIIEISIERFYTGSMPPEPDAWAEYGMDLLTVDRVYLDRYGGISPEGRIFCPPPAEWPTDGWIFANVNWDAVQYVGRKAVTASYQSSRAEICWEPGMTQPDTWQTYPRFTPDPGTTFVYSTNGKFASGTIHFEAYATGGYRVVTQNYDPSGALAPYDESCWDANGDGFCAVDILQNKSTQANVKTTAVKPVRR